MTSSPSLSDLNIIKMYRVFCTVTEMVTDRGYAIKHPDCLKERNTNPNFMIDFATFKKLFVASETTAVPVSGEVPMGTVNSSDDDDDVADASPTRRDVLDRDAMRFTCKLNKPHAATSHDNEEDEGATETGDEAKKKKKGDKEGGLIVFFASDEETFNTAKALYLRQKAIKKHASQMIIVVRKPLTNTLQRDIDEISARMDDTTGAPIVKIQCIAEDDLVFNVTKHETVPKHFPMTQAEIDEFLHSRELQIAQLPRMLVRDPIAQYFGLGRGDVVRIERISETGGPYDMYRQVI